MWQHAWSATSLWVTHFIFVCIQVSGPQLHPLCHSSICKYNSLGAVVCVLIGLWLCRPVCGGDTCAGREADAGQHPHCAARPTLAGTSRHVSFHAILSLADTPSCLASLTSQALFCIVVIREQSADSAKYIVHALLHTSCIQSRQD